MSINTSNKEKIRSKSIFAELSFASVGAIILMALIIVGSLILYIFMNQRSPKSVYVRDDAGIFSSSEEREIKRIAEKLSDKQDINVVIVTTRDKGRGYSNSDSDCAKFAGDFYADRCIESSFRDNSGICILIDLTEDVDGRRFFWIYTYGTAYFSITDDECTEIFRSHKSELQAFRYGEVIEDILSDFIGYDFNSAGIGFIYVISIALPAVLAFLITWGSTKSKKLDRRPNSSKYKKSHNDEGDRDIFLRKSVTVTHTSSSSGGGGGGGGGGGHSGGGGGRF